MGVVHEEKSVRHVTASREGACSTPGKHSSARAAISCAETTTPETALVGVELLLGAVVVVAMVACGGHMANVVVLSIVFTALYPSRAILE